MNRRGFLKRVVSGVLVGACGLVRPRAAGFDSPPSDQLGPDRFATGGVTPHPGRLGNREGDAEAVIPLTRLPDGRLAADSHFEDALPYSYYTTRHGRARPWPSRDP